MVKETCQKSTKKTTRITSEFTDARLTNYGGLVPFSDFLFDKLDFGQALAGHLDLGMGTNCHYQDWQLGVLAYNLSIWLRRLTDRTSWWQEPRTFREWFIRCAGKLVCHARRWTLNMQASYYKRTEWESIYRQVCRLYDSTRRKSPYCSYACPLARYSQLNNLIHTGQRLGLHERF